MRLPRLPNSFGVQQLWWDRVCTAIENAIVDLEELIHSIAAVRIIALRADKKAKDASIVLAELQDTPQVTILPLEQAIRKLRQDVQEQALLLAQPVIQRKPEPVLSEPCACHAELKRLAKRIDNLELETIWQP